LAGLIDSAVGGGGLIQVPGIFSILPNHSPATLLGTNKLSSICGTALASRQSSTIALENVVLGCGNRIDFFVHWRMLCQIITRRAASSNHVGVTDLMVLYTVLKKDLGQTHSPSHTHEKIRAITLGVGMGLYDGFFGPGLGSLLAFAFVRFFGYDFMNATAHSKIVNLATNIGALVLFIPHGNLL
jgi:uncharacterized membrane protein YfcA